MIVKIENKNNNKGFTLLEVLVAMAILAIVSVPLLRAFATSTFTNRKAKVEMLCTTAVENIAEDFKDIPIQNIIDKYSAATIEELTTPSGMGANIYTTNSGGYYRFQITNQDDINSKMPEGYYAEVELDPSWYPNANSFNAPSVESVSNYESAIFMMEEDYLQKEFYDDVCKTFADRYEAEVAAGQVNDTLEDGKEKEYFRDNLSREIIIVIDDVGEKEILTGNLASSESGAGAETKTVDVVKVNITIKYELENHQNILSDTDSKLTYKSNQLIYSNESKNAEFKSVYLFFEPLYFSNVKKDKITVENIDNVECNLYLIASHLSKSDPDVAAYVNSKALNVVIKETPETSEKNKKIEEEYKNDPRKEEYKRASIVLRTNLCNDTPYYFENKNEGITPDKEGTIDFNLTYQNLSGSFKKTMDANASAARYLSTSDVDGKSLYANDIDDRIYKMTIYIYNINGDYEHEDPLDDSSPLVPKSVMKFDGTKIVY